MSLCVVYHIKAKQFFSHLAFNSRNKIFPVVFHIVVCVYKAVYIHCNRQIIRSQKLSKKSWCYRLINFCSKIVLN